MDSSTMFDSRLIPLRSRQALRY